MAIHVLEYLEQACEVTPDKPAFIDMEESLSYRQVMNQAKAVAAAIGHTFSAIRRPVMVFSDRNVSSLVSFLGIAYSGNFYVPVDVHMPKARIELFFETLHPECVICLKKDVALAKETAGECPIIIYEESMGEVADEGRLRAIREQMIDTDPLYLIFTSGSTGTPKGVIKSQRSVLAFMEQFLKVTGIGSDDVLGGQAPFDFDVSAKDIYVTLAAGATLMVLPKSYFSFPKKLMNCLEEKKVTTLIWAVSALSIVAAHKALDYKAPTRIKRVLFSGEVLPIAHLNYWKEHLPHTTFVNLYAPTEVTGNCTYYVVDRDFKEDETLPLGKPFPNVEVMVLDQQGRRIEPGQTGEIYVRGAFLSMGYYENEERTKGAYVQNPLQHAYPELVYKTGDLALLDEEGEYHFLTREDFQIKYNGHRIELGEIETAVYSIDGVDSCACVYLKEHKKIFLFVCGKELDQKKVFVELKDRIPKYMFPGKIIVLEEMPFSKNLKIDRQKLLNMALEIAEKRKRR
ncbi:MAG: amino acid adenylation domain-containing protein [Lachnospiraceae bacterium]|nr:amino acid adenylation domain-containing protein [Lachnospiraceae bacterium]